MRGETFPDLYSCHIAGKGNKEEDDAVFEGNHEEKNEVFDTFIRRLESIGFER